MKIRKLNLGGGAKLIKYFARRDFEGLDQKAIRDLKEERHILAEELWNKRKKIQAQQAATNANIDSVHDAVNQHYTQSPNIDFKKSQTFANMSNNQKKLAGEYMINSNIHDGLKNEWKYKYNDALRNVRGEADLAREDALKETTKRFRNAEEDKIHDTIRELNNKSEFTNGKPNPTATQVKNTTTAKNWAKYGKYAAIGTVGLGAGYLAYRHFKNKNKQQNQQVQQ